MGAYRGQHFLISERIQKRIASYIKEREVIEIGPGKGFLTKHLLEEGRRVYGIEVDKKFYERLSSLSSSFVLVEGDVREKLKETSDNLSSPYDLVGNIPYYLSGFLFRLISELTHKPIRSVLLVQKEVAQKIVGEKGMNMLRAFVLWWGNPSYLFSVSPRFFSPPPRVTSGLVCIESKKISHPCSFYSYQKVVKVIYAHPRKTIQKNLLLGGWSKDEVENLSSYITLSDRPSQLSFDNLCSIALLIEGK